MAEIEAMREVGLITTECLDKLPTHIVKPGVSTKLIDEWVRDWAAQNKVVSATFGYRRPEIVTPFPGHCCISPNEVICHGIPSDLLLKDGDIVTIDVTFIKNGFHGDAARTYIIGQTNDVAKRLVSVADEARNRGVRAAKLGNKIGDIGLAIEGYLKTQRTSLVRDFVGHGIGQGFHMWPQVPFFSEPRTAEIPLVEGMFITIEPIVCAGNSRHKTGKDGWTISTRDGSWVAQFESTIAITANGTEILAS